VPKILIVEDDLKIIEAIQKSFSLEPAFHSRSVSDPAKVLSEAVSYKPELILLDIRLPGGDGRQLIKVLKENEHTKAIPVIFLTGMSSEGDRVLGLNLGADDYVVKPFGAMELLARIQAVLRRVSKRDAGSPQGVMTLRGLEVDPLDHSVTFEGKPVKLQPMEFSVLSLLAARPFKTLTRQYLIENISTYDADLASRSLDTHIKNLRKKLGRAGDWIETVPKVGYRLQPPA
jgi:DNA-binding response OmpR family regulator